MANQVKMAVQEAIIAYSGLGWSRRRIARTLGINRETVGRYLAAAKPAILPPGPEPSNPAIPPAGADGPKPAIVPAGVSATSLLPPSGQSGRISQCEPFKEFVEQALEQGLTAQRIYQDLVTERAFPGRYDAVKRYVRRLKKEAPERFFRLECLPGEEAQVDFGRGAPIRAADGKLRKTWVFRIVLSYSRKAYSEVVLRQTTDAFIRALENAFRYFGGVPETVIIDNLRAAVKQPDWYEPELNPKVREFARHYGTVILPTRPYTPEHKGKIENGIGYVKDNALKGKIFDSLAEENLYLLAWEEKVADQRIHGTTRQQVAARFQQEKPSLRPLPSSIFPCFQDGRRRVHRDSFVEVEKGYYEVPEEYIQRDVWVRWDGRTVRVFNDRWEQVAVHAQAEKGKFNYSSETTSRGRSCGVARSGAWLVQKAIKIGPQCGAWADAALTHRGVEAIRPLYGLLALVRSYTSPRIEHACEAALADSRFHLKDIKALLDAPQAEQETMPFLESHPLIRDIAEYGQFLQGLYPEEEIINTPQQEVTQV
ncbi:MAG: IS21 family transposase [Planctomycetota bacterium]